MLKKMPSVMAAFALAAAMFALGGCALGKVDFRERVSAATDAVFPSLVYIRVVSENSDRGKIEKFQASGSGVIISAEGELLTNHHVIDRAKSIRCQLSDGRMFGAKVIGSDKDLDIALLKIDSPEATLFPSARLSSRRLDVGDVVLAMGAPWGLARSVSMGIISCNDRYLEDCGDYTLWYQTDAAISPGNSGGPLVDTRGEVVGINARGNSAGAQAFTIPSPIITEILPNLRSHGSAHWAWFGIDWQPLKDFERDAQFAADEGVIVAGTDPRGPARKAGLKANDRVIAIDGNKVTAQFREEIPALNRALALRDWRTPVVFEFVRDGEAMRAEVTPTAKGSVEGAEAEFSRWGFTAKDVNRFDTPDLFFFSPEGGAFVSALARGGNAEIAGLKKRDIIKKIGEREIAGVADLSACYDEAIAALEKSSIVGVDVLRQGRRLHLVLNFREDRESEDNFDNFDDDEED